MPELSTETALLRILDWAYGKATDGLPGFGSANDLAEDYLMRDGTLSENVNALIRWQNTKAGTSGFLTGLGGLITLPVTVPANISVVLLVQVRMIAAIAIMGGYDVKDDRVRTLVYMCLAGNAAKEIMSKMGIDLTTRLARSAIQSISGKTLTAINQAVGFRLVTKFGEKGVLNMGRAIPLLGGVVGATFEVVSTNAIGNIAREVFCAEEAESGKGNAEMLPVGSTDSVPGCAAGSPPHTRLLRRLLRRESSDSGEHR